MGIYWTEHHNQGAVASFTTVNLNSSSTEHLKDLSGLGQALCLYSFPSEVKRLWNCWGNQGISQETQQTSI